MPDAFGIPMCQQHISHAQCMMQSLAAGFEVIQGTCVWTMILASYHNERRCGAYLGNLQRYPVLLPKLF